MYLRQITDEELRAEWRRWDEIVYNPAGLPDLSLALADLTRGLCVAEMARRPSFWEMA
jgi:hypothetical protein